MSYYTEIVECLPYLYILVVFGVRLFVYVRIGETSFSSLLPGAKKQGDRLLLFF